ncbi:hypothetical protein GCM10007978_23380 [Shewanella hanedai]|uniref:Uncharacterized protein n=1 Tax=Shewanella hanedai TaxID=25 RepID=A0A553JNE8_SHEHA|nr:hypothetical protein [Shewanella hanedai]TRY13963.1 hypothetical protein FN961_12605 [Shewanella hanedai]GGI84995.1 hypothetical protein GCM10007978_23380 [Shewanella hanedai]
MTFKSDKAKEFTIKFDELPDEAFRFNQCVPVLASLSAERGSLVEQSELNVIDVNLVDANSTQGSNSVDGFGAGLKDGVNSNECNGFRRYRTNLIFVFMVTIGHLLLILLLQQAWQPQVLYFPKQQLPKLKAYIYYEPKIEVIADNVAVEQIPDVEQAQTPLDKIPADEPLNIDTVKEAEVTAVEVLLAEDKALLEDVVDQDLNPAVVKTLDKGTSDQIGKPSLNLSQSTQGYFQRQRAQALDELVIEESTRYTRKRSLSEMDGEMIILNLPEYDSWAATRTFDSELDPNRIVKQGSTCYRVVKTPNPINLHAENLGYPFRCDGKSLVSDLQKAIAARAEKMGIKR